MLKSRGYEFVTVNQLLETSTAEMMPEMSSAENAVMMGDGVVTWLRTSGWNVLRITFMSATAVSILRILFVGILVIRHSRDKRPTDRSFTLPVTVVIPAYNEAKVIERKPIWRLWVVFIQRFYYRQFLYVVALKSVLQALKGSRQFWNKLERRGTVIAKGEAYMAPMATSGAIKSFAGANASAMMVADAVES